MLLSYTQKVKFNLRILTTFSLSLFWKHINLQLIDFSGNNVRLRTRTSTTSHCLFRPHQAPTSSLLIQATQATNIMILNVQCNLQDPTLRRRLFYSCTCEGSCEKDGMWDWTAICR